MESREENGIVWEKQAVDEMDCALQTIASEIKWFAYIELPPKALTVKETTDNGIIRSRDHSKLKTRRQYIARLRKDLRAACSVIKTLELKKKREVNLLKGLLSYARNECVDLLQRYNGAINKSLILHNQNQILNENLEHLNSVIQFEYEKLQEISAVAKAGYEPSTLGKLKKVLECCEKFHKDYCNESETSAKVQQSNRFLKNRLFILELNIGTLEEQLKNFEYQKRCLESKNDLSRREIDNGPTNNKVYFKADALLDKNIKTERIVDSTQNKELYLTKHMHIVKRLLSDQDNLLKDLDKITEELSSI